MVGNIERVVMMLAELYAGIDIYEMVGTPFYWLLIWIIFDVITGLLRAGKDRKLNSSINFDGLIRKLGELVAVVFMSLVDLYFGTDGIITTGGVYALIIYETISIVENFKRIGVNLDFIMKYFDKNKYEGEDKDE